MIQPIYHVTTPDYYATFEHQDHFFPTGLKEEGFIHCSYEHQLPYVLGKYYKMHKMIYLLKIDTDLLEHELKVELATVGDHFPHIYGVINKSAILEIIEKENEYYQGNSTDS